MNRIPPIKVRRLLRQEVGYGCPINNCHSPYLCWHHFDPPWSEKQHHNVSGMIALCSEHHAKADAASYTIEQLRQIKENAKAKSFEPQGVFDWMRNNLLAIVGGNYFYETPIILEYRGVPIIWFNRDENKYLLLNVKMLSCSNEPRLIIEDNFWISKGEPIDFEVPPSGKKIYIKYPNDDSLKVEFFEIKSENNFIKKYNKFNQSWGVDFPITSVEIHYKVGGTQIDFGPEYTNLPGMNLKGNFIRNCNVGIELE